MPNNNDDTIEKKKKRKHQKILENWFRSLKSLRYQHIRTKPSPNKQKKKTTTTVCPTKMSQAIYEGDNTDVKPQS